MGDRVELVGGPRCGDVLAWPSDGDMLVIALSAWARTKIHCVGWGVEPAYDEVPVYHGRYRRRWGGPVAIWQGED